MNKLNNTCNAKHNNLENHNSYNSVSRDSDDDDSTTCEGNTKNVNLYSNRADDDMLY